MKKSISLIVCFFLTQSLLSNPDNSTGYHIQYEKGNSQYSDTLFSFIMISIAPNLRTYYDLQSNGSSHMVQLDPNTPSNIHAAFMYSPNRDSLVSSRRTVYCFSSDYGFTWSAYNSITGNTSAGFPVMLIMSDGSALIGNHTKLGGTIERAQWFADVGPGAAAFIQLDPGIYGSAAALWPVGIQTKMLNNQTKFVFVAGNMLNRSLSLSSSNFSGYIPEPQISNSFRCAMAKSENGKIGLAYIMEGSLTAGKVSFKESTDDGITWSAPVLIWDPLSNNNYGAYNGIDVGYSGETPNVVFETVKYVTNIPDILQTAKIQFWSPALNSGIPIVIDSSNNMIGTNPQSDGYAAVCRPVIGYINSNPKTSIVVYEKARLDTGSNGNNYFDVWYRYSTNSGNTWGVYNRITNIYGDLSDYRYASISDFNDYIQGYFYVNLLFQRDTIAGSNVNGLDNSSAKMYFCRIQHNQLSFPGVININSNIPNSFLLKQNFPNPFNPKTNIDFDIPKESVVKLTVYNSQGEVVARLVNQQLSAGSYRVDWNAEIFSSGIYFYTISAGKYYEAKKMVLIR